MWSNDHAANSNQGEHFIMLQGIGLIDILDYQISLDLKKTILLHPWIL